MSISLMKRFVFRPCSRRVSIPTSQQSYEKKILHHTIPQRPSPFTPPLPYKQSINMLFQVMMGKSICEFSAPRSAEPPLSSSPATFLRAPRRTGCESVKYFQGLLWMRLNGEINEA